MSKTVLITGATGGIGLELARQFKAHGDQLILVGRRPLTELDSDLFREDSYCQADLSSQNSHSQISEWLDQRQIESIDLLVHNAGIGYYGDPEEESAAHLEALIQTNLKTPIALTWTLLKKLEKVKGRAVFVSSVVSVLPTAEYATYTASKAALDGFARSLASEMGPRIDVQIIHPGATRTDMHAKIGIPQEKVDYTKFPPAADVAKEIFDILQRPSRLHVTVGFNNKLLRTAGRSASRVLEWGMRRQSLKTVQETTPDGLAPIALVTGAADGIGRAVTVKLARAGFMVIGVDIDAEKGEVLKGALNGRLTFVQADLTKPEEIERVIESLDIEKPIELLINNAGISAVGRFEQIPLSRQLKVIDLNLTASILLTNGLIKAGCLMPGHRVVYLSSLSYYVGYPGAAVYAASKDGVSSFAASMHAAARLGGSSTTVYPGPVRTDHARRYSPDNSREDRRMLPEDVAELIVEGAIAGKRTIWPGAGAKVFALTGTLMPSVAERMMKRVLFDKLDGRVLQ